MKIIGIACVNYDGAIGYKNELLFKLKKDMELFKSITTSVKNIEKKNGVLMGYNTYKSIPYKYFPLINRVNFIISKKNYNLVKSDIENNKYTDTYLFNSIEQCIQYAKLNSNLENLYVIGGSSIYQEFMEKNYLDEIILNEIQVNSEISYQDKDFNYFPKFKHSWEEVDRELFSENNVLSNVDKNIISEVKFNKIHYNNLLNNSHNLISDELYYLNIIKDVLNNGEERKTRNSITRSQFGLRMEFNDINIKFPLLTTKKVFWKGIVEELLWFISANTNSKDLEKKGVKIWKGNSSREYLDQNGLNEYCDGDCGPIYGFQWRHFNAVYNGMDKNYENKGIDQLKNCIELIKNNPTSRRIFMTAWNPCQINEMVLPPCHVSYQFYVRDENKLDCQMYQRSGDLFLGVPFNIASTALLTSLIAKVTNKIPGKIIIILGDAHIYNNHIEQIKLQLKRKPYEFPTLNIKKINENINDYSVDDIELLSYYSHPPIKAEMVS